MATPKVTHVDVDHALALAQARLAQLGPALLELDEDKRRRAPQAASLRDGSAASWATTDDQMSVLWAWFQALSEAVEEVAARRNAPRARDRDLAAVWADLSTPSVPLSEDVVALARRCFPDSAGVAPQIAVTPLADLITSGYERVAETISSLGAVWDMVVPRLDELDRALAAATVTAEQAGIRLPNEARSIRNQIVEMSERATADPLGFNPDDIPPVAESVDRVRAALDGAVASLAALDGALEEATAELGRITAMIEEAREDNEEVLAKIASAPDRRPDLDRVAAAAANLQRAALEAQERSHTDRAAAGSVRQALEAPLAELRRNVERLAAAPKALLARRRELRGRLDGYRAKVQAMGWAEDPRLEELYAAARDALYVAPCALDDAEELVMVYQRALPPPGPGVVGPQDRLA
jgi:hypothetical protein